MKNLKNEDPKIYQSIVDELNRQRSTIELIASENFTSNSILEVAGSVLTNKYAEGYPGKRYYGGCESVDIAENIASQLERRIAYRRAIKRSIQSAMRMNIAGCKVMVGGRLNGAEIARSEWVREGQVRLHTLRVDIDYGVAEANTTYGIIGVKVWVFRGEEFGKNRSKLKQN